MTPKFIINWRKKLIKKIKKDPIRNILIILIAPILIYFVAHLLFDFSIIASVVYILVCIYAFTSILENPTKVITWGAGYLIGTIAIGLIFSKLIPILSKNDWTSIFSGIILICIIITILAKSHHIKKKR